MPYKGTFLKKQQLVETNLMWKILNYGQNMQKSR